MARRTFAAVLAGCGMAIGTATASGQTPPPDGNRGLPQAGEAVTLDPADFTTNIDNPYWPMKPGSRWVYRETDTTGARLRNVITVTRRTKKIANGITARVVRDVSTQNGATVEATDDWYAQDKAGNIWYLGERTAEYERGKVVSRSGSFEAGVGGAQAGVQMPANPQAGLAYRQEYRKGQAEDKAQVVSVGQDVIEVPFRFASQDVLMTRERTPLEPRVQELKFYARGIGMLLSVHTDGDGGREELISYRGGS